MFSLPLVFAALGLTFMYLCRRYERSPIVSPRVLAWLALPAGFFIAFGIPPLLYAAGGEAYSDTGMTVLLVLDAFGGGVFVFEAFFAHRYHPVGTPFSCGLFGFALAVTWADWPQVTTYVTKLPGKAGKVMGQESRKIHALHGAHGQAAHQQHVYLVLFAIIVVVLYLIARGRYKSRTQQHGGAPAAIPGPVLDRDLGVGTFFKRLWGRKKAQGQHGFSDAGRGPLPLDGPRPPRGGTRNDTGIPLPAGRE